jgi:hypothetical protein
VKTLPLDPPVPSRSGSVPRAAAAEPPGALRAAPWRRLRRALGALLALLVIVPAYRLMAHEATGYAGEVVYNWVTLQRDLLLAGMLLLFAPALLAARLLAPERVARIAAVGQAWLLRPGPHAFALAAAIVCGALTLAFSVLVLEARPNQIDSVVQLLHARFWAAGQLAGPLLATEFWHIQNAVITEHGWVSQYPPGHVLLLALGLRLGAVWLVGPLLAAITVYCAARAAESWLPHEPAVVRLGTGLLAISPFFIALAGAYMNHVTAAACLAAAALFATRAARGGVGWAVAAGAAVGYAFATRPLATLALGSVLMLGPWLVRAARARLPRNLLAACLGALPFVAALASYNARFFGAPHRFGYDVALGPSMGLGFGVDPWGNRYGIMEAIGWTSADLHNLSLSWLESPVPLVPLIGVFLLLAPRLTAGERILIAAPLLHLAANFAYWHHGIFMGPRMLHEAAPWWILLGALALVRIGRAMPARLPGALRRFSPSSAFAAFCAAGIAFGTLWLAPQRLASYGGPFLAATRVEIPKVVGPALVFVHDAWTARIAMTLAASGMRLDVVETLLRQNPTCEVAMLAGEVRRDPGRADAQLATMDVKPRALPLASLIAPGSRARIDSGGTLTGACAREAYSDRFGVHDVAPLTWLGDLPGLPPRGALFVRDLGPERNRLAIAAFGERTPFVYAATEPGGMPELLPYADGMRMLWGESTEEARP